jgi:hypothetical protein
MGSEDSANLFDRDGGSDRLLYQLTRDFLAVPQAQRSTTVVRALTRDLDRVYGDLRGKKTWDVPVLPDPVSPQGGVAKSV